MQVRGNDRNVHGSSMARWKTRDRIPISAIVFLVSSRGCGTIYSEICRNRRFLKRWVIMRTNFFSERGTYVHVRYMLSAVRLSFVCL